MGDMKRVADPLHAETTARYVKTSTLTLLDLTVFQIDRTTKGRIRGVLPNDLLLVMNGLWETGTCKGRLAAVCAMKRQAKTSDINHTLSITSACVNDLYTWAILDPLAIYCIGTLLIRDSHIAATLLDWGPSGNFWRRRASMLPYILLCRKESYREEYADTILAVLKTHLPDRELSVQKAVGWVLRELSKCDPVRVRSFTIGKRNTMAMLTAREGGRN
jgi:3-methyladenine DNA glycosylase AlkD